MNDMSIYTPSELASVLSKRIAILDGAIGTLIQQQGLCRADYHGTRFRDWQVNLTGNNDILNLTRPDVVADIHRQYVEAGADIITTNTFSSNRISQADYSCQHLAGEMAKAGAEIARGVADSCTTRKVLVAGSMGPTSKSLSLAQDANEPTLRSPAAAGDLLRRAECQGRPVCHFPGRRGNGTRNSGHGLGHRQ